MKKIRDRIVTKAKKMRDHHDRAKKVIGSHIHKSVHKHRNKIHHAFHTVSHIVTSIEHMVLFAGSVITFLGLTSFATWGGGINEYLIYPFQKVTTIDCRTIDYDTIHDDNVCLIDFPVIKDANYDAYRDNKTYTDFYTVLHAAPYKGDSWDMSKGSHLGVDMASSKNTPVYAIAYGEVTFAGVKPGYGNIVKMKFDYRGKTYHTIFAHLESILVKTGETVEQGQLVGKLGNSGSTFGALGGYHVHREITDDFYGGHAYGFYGCEDLNKGHIEIINNGLCRDELYKYTYDPIAFVEQSRQNLVHFNDPTSVTIEPTPSTEETHNSAEEISVVEVVVTENAEASQDIPDTDVDESVTTDIVATKVTVQDAPEVVPESIAEEVGQIASATITPLLTDSIVTKVVELEKIPAHKLSYVAQKFLENHTILVEYTTVNDAEVLLTMSVINNKTQDPFHGILPVSFQFLSNDAGVGIQKESVKLINQGNVNNTITFDKETKGSVVLMIDLQKLGVVEL